MNDTIGERIKARRKDMGLTLTELGNRAGVGASTVRKWEVGHIKDIRSGNLKLVATALNFTFDYLIGNTEINTMDVRLLPVIDGKMQTVEVLAADKKAEGDFLVRAADDGMLNARIFSGDLVFVKKCDTIENGEIAACIIDDAILIRRFYTRKHSIELRADNPLFKTLDFECKNKVKIIGRATYIMGVIK